MLANRLSFTLGTVGPSMTVDTACSSSLVALRQACLHLRGGGGVAGEKREGGRVALVGGVNLLLSPGPFDLFSKVGVDFCSLFFVLFSLYHDCRLLCIAQPLSVSLAV